MVTILRFSKRLGDCLGKAFFWRIFSIVLLVALGQNTFPLQHHLNVTFKGVFPTLGYAELYHSADVASFDPATQTGTLRVVRGDGARLLARISTIKPIKFIRFDPVIQPLAFQVEWLDIQGDSGSVHYSGEELAQKVLRLEQLQRLPSTPGVWSLQAEGTDAQIIFPVPKEVRTLPWSAVFKYWLQLLLCSGLLVLAFECFRLGRKRPPTALIRVDRFFGRVGRYLSDESTTVFSAAAIWVYFVLVFCFIGWVGLKLHQSSIGVWDNMYATAIHESSINIGSPREIRSDEWNSFTPWMLSQVQNGMQIDNPNLGARAAAVLTGAPVGGPLLAAQPKYWGFALFDIETGFSWFWAVKIFGMLAAVFSLLLMLTKGDVLVSLGGAFALYGTSLMQWWFSGIAPELLMGFSVSVIGSIYLLQATKRGGMIFGALLVSLVIPNLLLLIYPPHLLPLAYLAVFSVVGVLWDVKFFERFRYRIGSRLFFCALTLIFALGLGGLWWSMAHETIDLMLHTVYPGKRVVLGGDLDLAHVFHGIFESWRIEDWPLPFMPTNQTAASQMWVLFPLALVLIRARDWLSQHYRTALVLVVYCLMVVAWTSLPMPKAARALMAMAGWSLAPPWNALIGLGVASMLLMCILVAGVADQRMALIRWPRFAVPLLTAAVVGSYGMYLQSLDPEFFVTDRLALAAVFLGVFAWAIHGGRRGWFLALCVLSAVPGLQVNPIRNDFASYLGKDLFVQAKAVGGKPGDAWAAFGDTDIAQGFKSVGLTVVNGSHYAPRLPFVDILDPNHVYTHVWNRYAHIGFSSGKPGQPPVFKLMFPDQYDVSLDVCGKELAAMGVKFAAYTYVPSEAELRCLVPVPLAISDGRVGLYTIKSHSGL